MSHHLTMALTNRGVGQLKDLATMVAEEPLSDAQVEGDKIHLVTPIVKKDKHNNFYTLNECQSLCMPEI